MVGIADMFAVSIDSVASAYLVIADKIVQYLADLMGK